MSQQGSARIALLTAIANRHTLVLSNEILSETSRVLREPRLLSLHGKTENDVYEFDCWLREASVIVPLNLLAHGPVRDANDILVLQTALSGDAETICTLDRDFFTPPASDFLALRNIAVLTDVQVLKRLQQ